MGKQIKDSFETISPEAEAWENEIVARFTAGLFSIVRRKLGSLSKAAKPASPSKGYSKGYLARVQKGKKRPSFGMVARVLALAKVPFETFLRRMLELEWNGKPGIERSLTGHPVELLAEWREPGLPRESEFLARLGPWLDRVALLPLAGPAEPSRWRVRLLELEEERLRNWRKLRSRLERLTLGLARRLARQEQVAPAQLADLGSLVVAWAAAHRMGGLRGLAIDGFTLAFPLVERSQDLWAESFCLLKAAHLSHSLGHNEMALAMVNKAAVGLSEVGSEEDLARLAIDRGILYYQAGQLPRAQGLLETGLRRLGPERRQYRSAAHFLLARIAKQFKDMARARRELAKAVEIHDPATVEAGYMAWEAARFELQGRDWKRAEPLLRQALNVFARLGRADEIAFVALDYAELLFKAHRRLELKTLVGEVLGWLAPLAEANRNVLKPFQNLWALIVLDKLDLAEIRHLREDCKRATDVPGAESAQV